jgi:archaeosortase B (VPXXXP-CTERM-specific)
VIAEFTRLLRYCRDMAKRTQTREDRGKKRGTSRSKRAPNAAPRQLRQTIVSAFMEKARENREAINYVLLFLVLCLLFYLLYYALLISGSGLLLRLREFTASLVGFVFSAAGADVMVNGALVSINGFGLEIIDECTAVFSSIVYCACILAYPSTPRKKVVGVALGVPALYAINILRLSILALVGIYSPHLFEFVHVYLWQATFIIFVVLIFLLWLRFVVKE